MQPRMVHFVRSRLLPGMRRGVGISKAYLDDSERHFEDVLTRAAVLATFRVRADGSLEITDLVLEPSEVAMAHLRRPGHGQDVSNRKRRAVRRRRTRIDSLIRFVK